MGKLIKGEGLLIQDNCITMHIGISLLPKTGNKIFDTFLDIPLASLTEVKCEIK